MGLCVCLLSHISPMERLFVLKTLSRTQRTTKVKKYVGFSLKPLRCRDTALAHCTAPVQSAIFTPRKTRMRIFDHARALALASSRATTRTIRRSMRTCAHKTKSSTQHLVTRQSSTASQQLYVKNADFLRNETFLAMHDQRFIWHIS